MGQHFVAASISAMGQQLLPLLYGCRRMSCSMLPVGTFNSVFTEVSLICLVLTSLVLHSRYCLRPSSIANPRTLFLVFHNPSSVVFVLLTFVLLYIVMLLYVVKAPSTTKSRRRGWLSHASLCCATELSFVLDRKTFPSSNGRSLRLLTIRIIIIIIIIIIMNLILFDTI